MSNQMYTLDNNEWIIVNSHKKINQKIHTKSNGANGANGANGTIGSNAVHNPDNTFKFGIINTKNRMCSDKSKINESSQTTPNNSHQINNNLKKMLCKNMILKGSCTYGENCLYAHNLTEQNMNHSRKIAYEIIKSNNKLDKYNLTNNNELYNTLLTLSKLCEKCKENKCTGGYNCKNGACNEKYVVCFNDLTGGICDQTCGHIHLSKRGLIPRNKQLKKNMQNNSNIFYGTEHCDNYDDIYVVLRNTRNTHPNKINTSIFDVKIEDLCKY